MKKQKPSRSHHQQDTTHSSPARPWHTLSSPEICRELNTTENKGLSKKEAQTRLEQYGPNTLILEKKEPFWKEFLEELSEPMVLMLLFTGTLYAAWGEAAEAITIFLIILALNTVEVINETRAKKAIQSLRKLTEPTAIVEREEQIKEIPSAELVPGDLIHLRPGRRVPADARLLQSFNLAVDESILSGESLPDEKNTEMLLGPSTPLAERKNMLYASTLIQGGKGTALVVATGEQTEIGRISGLTRSVKEPPTPLQKMMDELSKTLIWFALGFSVLVPLLGILFTNQEPKKMLLTGLSLAFATIPEELPIIISMVLALGAFRLSKKQAIVRHLYAVETLGSVTLIAADKTGTLTENKLRAVKFEPADEKKELLLHSLICSEVLQNQDGRTNDPLDRAFLNAAIEEGIYLQDLHKEVQVLNEFVFKNQLKRMSVICSKDKNAFSVVKGAPEVVLPLCSSRKNGKSTLFLQEEQRREILEKGSQMAAGGLRVIAFASRSLQTENVSRSEAESGLTFLGLAGLADTPRPEAEETIRSCRQAGIRMVMISGDHPATVRSIAKRVGLDDCEKIIQGSEIEKMSDAALAEKVKTCSFFARSTPEHKLRIVQAFQSQGQRVALTGDGVNDAPALAAADIGLAMGKSGSDVAREAADLVLGDDHLTTILNAVGEGRLIFENLKKGVKFYLACKLALVLITLLPALLMVPVPFTPVQIILMELFMDLMAAATFVKEPAEADLLKQKPRDPQARFLDKTMLKSLVGSAAGLFLSVSTLYLFAWYTNGELQTARTLAFFGWLSGHVMLALNLRSERQPLYRIGLRSNPLLLVWATAVIVFLILVSVIPFLRSTLEISILNTTQWILVIGLPAAGTFWMEICKLIKCRK